MFLSFTFILAEVLSLEVFVIPHSHNDAGWLLTLDQYYISDTRKILNNLYEILNSDSEMKFS